MTTAAHRLDMLRSDAAGLLTDEATIGTLAAYGHWLADDHKM
jgi:hypothetical protein